jgi:signal transduction histidine kinase
MGRFPFAAFVASVLPLLGTVLHADTPARQFLVIYEHHSSLIANIEISRGIEDRLAEALPTEREVYSVYLDSARFPSNPSSAHFLGQLEDNFSGVSFDAVLAVGPAALTFSLENRGDLAPGAPILFTGIAEQGISEAALPPDVGGVYRAYDMARLVEFAMELQPEASRIVVMAGTAGFDRDLAERARNALGSRFAGLPVSHVSGLSLAEYVEEAQGYDRNAILLLLTFLRDGTGRTMLPSDAARAIAAASGAPTYGFHSTYLEAGVTAGHVTTFPEIGGILADMALGAIEGGGGARLPIAEAPAADVVNWPQLARFGIDTSLVPPDARRLYYDPPVWQRYRREISIAFFVLLLQTATIAALLMQMHRKKRLTTELEAGRRELAYAARGSQLGQLSGAIAHELNQPLTAILSNAQAAARTLRSSDPDLLEISEILSDIIDDDRRAAAIIRQLRRLMKEGDVDFEAIDLDEVVAATLELSHSELVARRTDVEFKRSGERLSIHGNMTQLQQVVLNLLLNAADAMRGLPPDKRQVLVETKADGEASCQLAVSDRGPGLSMEEASAAFKPFVTSKCDGLGLGLSICLSIAKAHGGTLAFDQKVVSGSRIVLTIPRG